MPVKGLIAKNILWGSIEQYTDTQGNPVIFNVNVLNVLFLETCM